MSYQFITTADGSPTLEWQQSPDLVEKMHHSQGALSESLYIYLPVIQTVAEAGWPLKFMSLGLGLGYNEMILAAWLKKQELQGRPLSLQRLHSFESQDLLKDQLLLWLGLAPANLPASEGFSQAYDCIVQALCRHFQLPAGLIQQTLVEWRQSDIWQLKGAYLPSQEPVAEPERYSGLFYDAFSSKMNPELWSEEGLVESLQDLCEPNCVLATYAAKGSLKRALRRLGFAVDLRPGFAGKRQCTLAIRSCQPSG